MADVEPQSDTPTEQEMEAAGGAGNYEGTPISDDKFAEVWEPPSARGDGGEDESGGDMAGGDQAGSGGGTGV